MFICIEELQEKVEQEYVFSLGQTSVNASILFELIKLQWALGVDVDLVNIK